MARHRGHRSGGGFLRTGAATLLVAVVVGVLGAWGACAKSLDALAPFPCAKDQSCPDGFTCESVTGSGMACVATFTCTGAMTPCNGTCVDLTVDDAQNCGGCGIACGSGDTCCSQACASLGSDPSNCGKCGNACAENESCVDGKCACEPPNRRCGGACTDTQTDPNNCGACGASCGNDGCAGGACQPCPPQTTQCSGTCVYTEGDPANCGACGSVCPSGEPCQAGVCGTITCGSVTDGTCNDTSWVIYCDTSVPSSPTITCCAPDHPFYCPDMSPGGCWNIPIDCSAAVMCSDGQWHGCLPGQTFDCASMMCS